MGQQSRVLVIMTNSDVYYVSESDSQKLAGALISPNVETFTTRDVKSGAVIVLHLRNISSLVKEADRA